MNRNKEVSVMFSTIDFGRTKVDNIQLLEIDVDVFNEMSKEEFVSETLKAAQEFWIQMARGRLRNNLLAPKIKLTKEEVK